MRVHVKNVSFALFELGNLLPACLHISVNYKVTALCEADIRVKCELKGDAGAKDSSDFSSTQDCMKKRQEMCMTEMIIVPLPNKTKML